MPIALKPDLLNKNFEGPYWEKMLPKFEQLIRVCAADFKKHHDQMTDPCCKAVKSTMTTWHNKLFALDAQAVFKHGKTPTDKQVKKLAKDMGKVTVEEHEAWKKQCGKRVQNL